MEMHEIRYFLAACRTLNFHKAAALVHVTQPALTRAIKKLEAELGGPLFHRDHGHVQLTDFGCLMRPELDGVLRRSEKAKHTAGRFLRLEAAPLRLGIMSTIGPRHLIGFLDAFRQRHPGIEVTTVGGSADRLIERLLAGSLDVAMLARPQPIDSRLSAEPVYEERFGLAFAAGHRFELRNALHVSDLRGETCLRHVHCEYADHVEALCGSLGIVLRCAHRSDRQDWILAMVAAGMGVALMAEFSVNQPGVCHRPVADPGLVRAVSLVLVAGRARSPAVATFAAALLDHDWGALAPVLRMSGDAVAASKR